MKTLSKILKYSLIAVITLTCICIGFQFQFDASNEADKWMNQLLIETILLIGGLLMVIWLIFMRVKESKNNKVDYPYPD
jgi:hypothetical protein